MVLVHPLIPPNTGSIGRLCAATHTTLVLVRPLGFRIDDKHLKRAGLDYWPWIDLQVVDHWQEALLSPGRNWLFSSKGERSYLDVCFGAQDKLVFGTETTGLPQEILDTWPEGCVEIPMENPNVRSLNLAQCAAIGLYEARRQLAL